MRHLKTLTRTLWPILLLCALSALQLLASCAFQDRAVRRAYVYGISLYNAGAEGTFPNLRYCDDDAEAIALMLEANGYTVNRRITGTTYSSGPSPDKAQILADLAAVPADTDRLVVYYSGHGARIGSGETAVDYIVPVGGVGVSSPYPFLAPTSISAAEMDAALEGIEAPQILLILDSCYSGGFVSQAGQADIDPPLYGEKDRYGPSPELSISDPEMGTLLLRFMQAGPGASGRIVLSAAGAMEVSWESLGHGIFTGAILEAPSAGADINADGIVSAMEIHAFAAAKVSREWNTANYDDYYWADSQYMDFMPRISAGSLDFAFVRAD
jgi:hypothetical protein